MAEHGARARTVQPAEPRDVEAIVAVLEEMDRFYGATVFEPIDERIRQAHEALFAEPPGISALVAWDGDQLIGLASYSFLWPAVGLTRSLYLKELYVSDAARRQGVGRQLMAHLIDLAQKHSCSRVEWTADADNPGAQQFYAELGFEVDQSKLFFRVSDL